ncbi:N-acetylmuramoyl-L-alanine amidase [Enterovirga aerilata]|uniref:N-acetylmuramoyl-L-alanine amidase n=1 Tax=Enterovirga aerilata TaxID=2730920 RepID=A0A849I369_9HYPH|nr:N-acetylmuramoyl-L-alanine amidase [Enterovirga sp. DB1703]
MSGRPPDGEPGAIVSRFVPSPNHGERRGGRRPDLLLLHYTGMPTAEMALQRLRDPAAEVSAHYVVLEDGTVVQLVPEDRRAHHAGVSYWAGETDINSCSIGIEIVNPGHEGGLPPYPEEQITSVIELCRAIVDHWGIVPERVLAHSDVAPSRKEDPGELFPWDRLAEAGIGHWVAPQPPTGEVMLQPGDTGPEVEALQDALAFYGYSLQASGTYDEPTRQVVTAFQRHFRPARVDGVVDSSTLATLRNLIASRPG